MTLFWDERGVILEHYMPRGTLWPVQRMQISSRITCVLQSGPNNVDSWVQVFCCNMTMLGPILPVQLLQQSKICPSSVFHIRRTRQTSPQVIFTSLDHSMRRWEASLSGPTTRCSWRCTSGCNLRQNIFFSRGLLAIPKRWNTCMERNGDYAVNDFIVYLVCSIKYEIKNI